MDASQPTIFEVTLDDQSKSFLLETCKWGKFLSVISIIGSVIVAIMGLVFLLAGSALGLGREFGQFGWIAGLFYLVLGVIGLIPSLQLMRFSSNIPAGIQKDDQLLVTQGFGNLRACFRIWGIFTIVLLAFYVLAIIGGSIFASLW